MNQISLITELIYKQQQQELLNELAGYRLLNNAVRAKKRGKNVRSKFLLTVGKLLQSVGQALEKRYGGYIDLASTHIQEPSHSDCA